MVTERCVRPAVVVVVLPFLRFLTDLIERPEDIGIEEFTPEAAVQAFDTGVLRGFTGLDKRQHDLSVFAPRIEALADELRAVVYPDHGGKTAAFFELLQHADDALGWRAGIGLDAKDLPVVVVEDIQHPDGPPALPMLYRLKAVVDAIQAPDPVGLRRLEESLPQASREPFLGASPDIESERRVDPVHAFVIPRSPGESQPVVRLPEADRWVLGDECVQRVDHRLVLLRRRFVPIRAPGQADGPAALTDAHAVLRVHVRDQSALLARA